MNLETGTLRTQIDACTVSYRSAIGEVLSLKWHSYLNHLRNFTLTSQVYKCVRICYTCDTPLSKSQRQFLHSLKVQHVLVILHYAGRSNKVVAVPR